MRRSPIVLAAVAAAAALGPPVALAQEKQPTAQGRGGAAASVDPLATRAAVDVLRDGGNAVDAAVAAAGVLGVVEPYSCGVGGGGFMVIRDGKTGKVTTIDSREKSPAAMLPNSFFIDGQPPTSAQFNVNRFSGLSAGVPGTPKAWRYALRHYGTYKLPAALAYGERVARRGFQVDQTFFDQTLAAAPYFADVPSTASLYLDADGTPKDVGTTLRNPGMARTYARMARLGVDRGFYQGRLARAIARAARKPPISASATHSWRPGLLTAADLRAYRVRERAPVTTTYHGDTVYGMGPPSSGGTTVAEALNILTALSQNGQAGKDRAQILHRYLEASRLAFADRNAYVADPAFTDVPLAGLVSPSYGAERAALTTNTALQSPVAPGNPRDNAPAAGSATVTHPGQSTTNLTVADRNGTVVEYTFTIESTGGNGIVVPGWGFLLNNELTDFDTASTTAPNRPERNKRPRSSIAPTIIERDGRPILALGSPGGATIITTVLQILVDHYELKDPLPVAIAAPRASQRNSATTEAEPAFIASQAGQTLFYEYGQRFRPTDNAPGLQVSYSTEIGAATGIQVKGRRFLAAAEPTRRGGGSAMVVRPAK
jgi:gamma-glutamyltranspeptidase / glutathione hydrolase